MRALYNKNFEELGYVFGLKGYKVNPYSYFSIFDTDKYGYKTVVLKAKLDVFYKGLIGSFIQTTAKEFKVDKYGNYASILDDFFGGILGSQRVGDTLSSDYGLLENY